MMMYRAASIAKIIYILIYKLLFDLYLKDVQLNKTFKLNILRRNSLHKANPTMLEERVKHSVKQTTLHSI